VCQRYISLKERNSYLKIGLETAENFTQPVLRKLDDKLHLDDKGVAILDRIENTAHGITTTANGITITATGYYTQQKENAKEVTHSLINSANRPVHYLLDYTESILDHILPPVPQPEPIAPVGETDDEDSFAEATEADNYNNTTIVMENPLNRIKRITVSVPYRLAEKFVPLQMETVGYATEILKYAYETVDVEGKKVIFYENAVAVQKKFEEKKDDILRMVTPAKEILERQTADIKDKSIKAYVTAVSAITHVSEIIRQQLAGTVLDPSKVHDHLSEVINLTKSAISKLKEHELAFYVQKFRENAFISIQTLVDVSYAYAPESLIPLLTQISKLSHNNNYNNKPANGQSEEPPSD
jgi:hypothetical protein